MEGTSKKEGSDLTLSRKIDAALIVNMYKQAKTGYFASFLCGSIIFSYLFSAINHQILITWYVFFTIIILVRIFLVNAFTKDKNPEKKLIFWRNLFIACTFLSGLSWGLTGTPLLLSIHNTFETTVTLVILAGISAGAVPLYAHVRTAALAFLLPALVPLIIHFIAIMDPNYILFDCALIIYLLYLITLIFKTHSIVKNSIQLQFENVTLLENLTDAKNKLELTNKKLKQEATHDPLTQIANRSLFEINLLEAIHRADRDKKFLALFYLDLDNFKEVNDLHGHHIGDKILLIAVSRIKNVLREQDIVYRLGGDELAIIIEDIKNVEAVSEIADRICDTIAKPIYVEHIQINVFTSIGISIYPVDGEDMDTLIRVADRAMYYVKDHGGNNYHFNVQLDS